MARSILDDLEHILGADNFAKVKNDPRISKRIKTGDEFYQMYAGVDDDEDATTTTTTTRTEPTATATTSPFGLGDFEALLDKKLGGLDERVKTTATAAVDEVVKTAGERLVQETTARTIRAADELNRIYRRHEKDFGEELDSTAFDTYLQDQIKNGTRYATMTKAYEDFTRDKRTDKAIETKVEEGVREKLKARATTMEVPGVTPSSARSPLTTFLNRGKKTDDTGTTSAGRAGQALSERLAANANLQ